MDKTCFAYLIINAIAYFIYFLFYQIKKKIIDLGSVILAAWNVGSWGAVYYYTFEVSYLSYSRITLFPLIVLFVSNCILFNPFLKTDYTKYQGVYIGNLASVFRLISLFFVVVGILPFLNVVSKLSSFSLVGAALAEMYSSDEDKTKLIFSPLVRPLYSILRHFVPLVTFLFFYNLTLRKKKLFIITGLAINIITFFLVSLLSGSRGGMMTLLVSCIYYAFFMRHMLVEQVFNGLKRVGFILVGFLILGIGFISISRLSDMSQSKGRELLMDQWLSQYAGEGIIRFDNTIWYLDNKMNGYQNLPYLYSFFDSQTKDLDTMANIGESKLKTPITVFYTYFGDLVIDYGIVGGLVVVIIISQITKYLISAHRNKISFYHLILLNYIFTYITIGFTANLYRTYYTQVQIVYIVVLLMILYLIQNLTQKNATISHCHTSI